MRCFNRKKTKLEVVYLFRVIDIVCESYNDHVYLHILQCGISFHGLAHAGDNAFNASSLGNVSNDDSVNTTTATPIAGSTVTTPVSVVQLLSSE